MVVTGQTEKGRKDKEKAPLYLGLENVRQDKEKA